MMADPDLSSAQPPDPAAVAAPAPHLPRAANTTIWRRLLGHRLFITGVILFGMVLAMALFADLLATAAPRK